VSGEGWKQPTHREVYEVLYPARAQCHGIGTMLGVDHGTLKAIKKNSPDVEERLGDVIDHWLKNASDKSWRALLDSCESILSEDIKKKIVQRC